LHCVAVCCSAVWCPSMLFRFKDAQNRLQMVRGLQWVALNCREFSALVCLLASKNGCEWFVGCSVLRCVVVGCSGLQWAAVGCMGCSVGQCGAAWCSVLQCVAVRCSGLQWAAVVRVLQCGSVCAVCCSVLHCVAVCCRVLKCAIVE